MLTFFIRVLYFSHQVQNEADLKIKCLLAKRGAARHPQQLKNSAITRHPIESPHPMIKNFCRPLEQFPPAKEDKDKNNDGFICAMNTDFHLKQQKGEVTLPKT